MSKHGRADIAALRVDPGSPARIQERDPDDTLGLDKDEAKELLDTLREQLAVLHQRLYAESRHSVLLVLQGLDASGKDGVIRSVFSGLNPQGCRVVSFKAPTSTELAHDYFWRVHAVLPARGDVSKVEQRKRLQERIDNPEKRWKFRLEDLDVRKRFDDYIAAYEDALTETSTEWAPWYVVPADRNWVKALAVTQLLVDTLGQLDPQLPDPEPGSEGLVVE